MGYLDVLSQHYEIDREEAESRAAGLISYLMEAEYDGAKVTVTYLKASSEGALETSIRVRVTDIMKGQSK